MLKISLVGLSGAGKTTTLKFINPNAFIMDSQVREITEMEAEAWEMTIGTRIPTTTVPNFSHIIINDDGKIVRAHDGTMLHDEHIVHIIDTCGQEVFFNLTRDCINESNGILFIIDSTVPIMSQMQDLMKAYANVMSNFNDYVPVVVCLNKQDILQKKKTERNKSNGSEGEIEKTRPILKSFLPELKTAQFFNTSAELGWNVKQALEALIGEIMDKVYQKIQF